MCARAHARVCFFFSFFFFDFFLLFCSKLSRNLKLFPLSENGFTTYRQNLCPFLVSIIYFPDSISDFYLDEYDCRKPKMIVFASVDPAYMVGVSSHVEIFKKEKWYARLKINVFM